MTPSNVESRSLLLRYGQLLSLLLVLTFLVLANGKQPSPAFSWRCTPSFLNLASSSARCGRTVQPTKVSLSTLLPITASRNPNNDQEDEQSSTLPPKFNPFSYQTSSSSSSGFMPQPSSSSSSYNTNYSTRISLRKTKMQELNQQLLNAATESQLQELLEENKEFLLEPLEDDDAVLEEDSIYNSTMGRAERYQAYRRAMEERLASSRNAQVQRVLSALKDFVLSHE